MEFKKAARNSVVVYFSIIICTLCRSFAPFFMRYYINLVLSFIVIWRIFALSFIKNGLFLGLYFIFFRIFADKSYIEGYDEK